MARTGKAFAFAFFLSFVFMYLVLAAQFESWLHPFTIMLSLPLTVPFAFLSVILFGNQLDIFSMLGLALVGRFGTRELLYAALTLPPMAAGFTLAKYTHRWLDGGHTRKGVLAIALVSGAAVIVKALRGLSL